MRSETRQNIHRCIKSENVPHVLSYRSSGTVSTGRHLRLTIYHTSVFCLRIFACQKATEKHISARSIQYQSLRGCDFRYQSHLRRTVHFAKIFSSYNLNFKINKYSLRFYAIPVNLLKIIGFLIIYSYKGFSQSN